MHRHRYFGVLAQPATRQTEPATTGEGTQIRKILDHIGVDSETGAHMARWQARGPPLSDACDVHFGEGVAAPRL